MMMTNDIARLRVARGLQQAEIALDDALLKQAELMAELVNARRAAGLGTFAGHEVLLRVSRSQQTLLEATGDLARAHGKLKDFDPDQARADGSDGCPPAAVLAPVEDGRRAA